MSTKTVIKPQSNPFSLNLPELWQYRELFYILAWRDIKVRYKQTFLGILWVILQPLASTFIFTIFFGRLAQIPSGGLPYALFVLIGLVFWNFFNQSVTNASNSTINNEAIIKKIYFPRLILPLGTIVTASVDFAISLVLLSLAFIYFQISPTIYIIPAVIIGYLIVFITASGIGMFLSSVNVKYRDVRYILPFFTQLLLFLTPVIYPTTIVRPSNRLILALNPVTGVIEMVRASVDPSVILNPQVIAISVVSSLLIFIFGVFYFRRTESFFADII